MTLRSPAGVVDDLSTWSATFEIFDLSGVSRYRYESADGLITVGLWDSGTAYGSYNVYLGLPNDVTSALVDWGVGVFNCDLVDPMGHVSYRIHGPITLEWGSLHA